MKRVITLDVTFMMEADADTALFVADAIRAALMRKLATLNHDLDIRANSVDFVCASLASGSTRPQIHVDLHDFPVPDAFPPCTNL